MKLEHGTPMDIEGESMRIIREELSAMGVTLPPDRAAAEEMLRPLVEQVRETLGDVVYGVDVSSLEQLLARREPPEVLVCNNNHLALQCLQQVRRLGLEIPAQIALITFDNYPFSMLTEPAITAVDLDMHEMGINAARFILQRIRKPNLLTQSYCTSPAVLERAST